MGGYEITTASFNAKISRYMYKKIYICKHILLYNYYTVYAYFIMDIIMHICILSFIYFNKHYIVHSYFCRYSLFISARNTLDYGQLIMVIKVQSFCAKMQLKVYLELI